MGDPQNQQLSMLKSTNDLDDNQVTRSTAIEDAPEGHAAHHAVNWDGQRHRVRWPSGRERSLFPADGLGLPYFETSPNWVF